MFYKNTEQISEKTDYKFELPKYGKSTTDPTYYEPSATRIANMRKSATSGKSLYDFTGEDLPKDKNGNPDWSKQDITKARITPGRKPGMTREEISQNLTDLTSKFKNEVEKNQAEKEAEQKQIEQAKNIKKSLQEATNSEASETK